MRTSSAATTAVTLRITSLHGSAKANSPCSLAVGSPQGLAIADNAASRTAVSYAGDVAATSNSAALAATAIIAEQRKTATEEITSTAHTLAHAPAPSFIIT